MANLIKADLLRIIKDKLFLILVIIGGALAIVMPLFYFGLFSLLVDDGMTVRELLSASDIALAAFSPFSNFGLVLAIFMCIIITKDFGNGTIRNKIVMGKTRAEVYFSNAISSLIVIVGVVLSFSLLQFMISCLFFKTGFTADSVQLILECFVYQLLGWVVLALAMNFYATVMKNAGLAIIVYVIVGLVLTFAASIISGIIPALEYNADENKVIITILKTLSSINFVGEMSTTLAGSAMSIMGVSSSASMDIAYRLEYIISTVSFGLLFCGCGYLIFKKKDLK